MFFGLGAYAMAMHLKLDAAGPGNVPDFMILYGDGTMPAWWEPFRSGAFTLVAIVRAAGGRRRRSSATRSSSAACKGAYFAILTQALAVAFATLLIAHDQRDRRRSTASATSSTFFGYNLYDPVEQADALHRSPPALLIACLLVVWQLNRSRFGELLVATRDAEERVRFLGYDPANIKLVAYVVAAIMASIGGRHVRPDRGHHLAVGRRRLRVDHA